MPEAVSEHPDDQLGLDGEIEKAEVERQRREEKRGSLLRAADSAGQLGTIEERVAWILNHYPETRESDQHLWFRYWSVFESDAWDGRSISLDDADKLTRPGSLTRARARIQNSYDLFLASHETRRRRGVLAEEEREKAIAQVPPAPLFSVYADESGKTSDHLIVGSVWFLHAPEIIKMRQSIDKLKGDWEVKTELHFKEISERSLEFYLHAAAVIATSGAAVSFKAISVERRGVPGVGQALSDLFYHLLLRGVEHENDTQRARLPRRIGLTKDLEEVGRDKLLMANLHDRITQAGAARFGGQLVTTDFIADASENHQLLQIADLYTGSIGRILNNPSDKPKDTFAREFLAALGTPQGPNSREQAGDMAVLISL